MTAVRTLSNVAPLASKSARQLRVVQASTTPVANPTVQNQHVAPTLERRLVRLFGVDVSDTTLRTAAEWMVNCAQQRIEQTVSFLNAHCVNVMYSEPHYRAAVQSSSCVFADGAGISIAARSTGTKLKDNVNGTDLFPIVCELAAKSGTSIFLLGGRPGLTAKTAMRMMASYPGLSIAGSHHGYFTTAEEERQVIQNINKTKPGILLVGLGVPTQELWINRNRARLDVPVVAGVGGLFDYYSGRIPRAPRALRAAGLEWLWRLTMEPRRLAKRYLVGNIAFLSRLAWYRLSASRDFCVDAKA
ncbi:MAG: WecB/TagA/CpsF family glycosyltransferase [Hyphomicrobium sp.]|nr:WecB/TagA/CpsF family glycosyltransferase [Hyphomicrobium sp.]